MTKSQCIQSLKEQGYTLKALDENETKVLKNWKDDPTSDDVIENNYGVILNQDNQFVIDIDDSEFNEVSIKKLYHILTKDMIMPDHGIPYPKGYKKMNNEVGLNPKTGLAYKTSPHERVPEDMKKLLTWYKENKNKLHPFELAFEFYIKYETIHPFLDGNGRTGRMIMNKILISNGYMPMIVHMKNSDKISKSMGKYRDGHKTKYMTYMISELKKTYLEFYQPRIKK